VCVCLSVCVSEYLCLSCSVYVSLSVCVSQSVFLLLSVDVSVSGEQVGNDVRVKIWRVKETKVKVTMISFEATSALPDFLSQTGNF